MSSTALRRRLLTFTNPGVAGGRDLFFCRRRLTLSVRRTPNLGPPVLRPSVVKRPRGLLGRRQLSSAAKFSDRRSAFAALRIPYNSNEATIKKAYLGLAKEWHPDRHINKTDKQKVAARDRFDVIKAAFDYLQEHPKEEPQRFNFDGSPSWRQEGPSRGSNQHFGKAPPTNKNPAGGYTAGQRTHAGRPVEEVLNKNNFSSKFSQDYASGAVGGASSGGWGRMAVAVALVFLFWLALQNERAKTRFMRRTHQGKEVEFISKKDKAPPLPQENPFVKPAGFSADMSVKDLEEIRQLTGIQPIKTGRGWDWTPVARAYTNQNLKRYDKNDLDRRVEEHQLKQDSKKRLIKKVKKYKKKTEDLEKQIAALTAQLEEKETQSGGVTTSKES